MSSSQFYVNKKAFPLNQLQIDRFFRRNRREKGIKIVGTSCAPRSKELRATCTRQTLSINECVVRHVYITQVAILRG
jgi:O-phosphoseryl-tRNA(Cys) synthetase